MQGWTNQKFISRPTMLMLAQPHVMLWEISEYLNPCEGSLHLVIRGGTESNSLWAIPKIKCVGASLSCHLCGNTLFIYFFFQNMFFLHFLTNLVTCHVSYHQPTHLFKGKGKYMFSSRHVKPARFFLSNCCSSCIAGQCNTLGRTCYLPSYMSSRMPSFG